MQTPSRLKVAPGSEQNHRLLARTPGLRAKRDDLFPLSSAQQRLWFLEQLAPGTAANNISSGLRLTGNLDIQMLRLCVARIVARHETLRTSFVAVNGEAFQSVTPSAQAEISIVDLREIPEGVREQTAYNLACEEARRPFDLQRSTLFRLKLLRLGDEEHVLVLTMHHLVSDAWSLGVFLDELTEVYAAGTEGRGCLLAPISIQYADYAEWQRESLANEELARQIAYWKTRLAETPFLHLPTDRVRPAEPSLDCRALSVPLPEPLIGRLKLLALQEDTTFFTILLAVFHVLLFRYSQQENICTGVPVAGRRLEETEALIGLFVNTLVIRSDLSENPKFKDLLAQINEAFREAEGNQDVPFERIVKELQPKRSLAYNPVFQVMMTAFKEPVRRRRFGGLAASPYVVSASSSHLDLTAQVIEAADGGSWLRFEYNATLFEPARIQRMAEHYKSLLENVVQNPGRRIGDLSLVTMVELEQLSAWNGTSATYPAMSVHELIAEQAARTPDRVAAIFESQHLTYAELHRQAKSVAALLRDAGICTGARVAVCLERSLEMIVGVLGVLYAGAAYVPLDPEGPPGRLTLILNEASVALLLTQRRLLRQPLESVPRVLIEDALRRSPEEDLPPQDPESLAYVIFTSGSTGKPKGVCVSHLALVNLLLFMRHEPGLTQEDKFLAVTNLCFDISALELFLPLIAGAQLVIANQNIIIDGSRLLDCLKRYAITIMQATPSTWRLLLAAGWSSETHTLKVLCGGEALPADLAKDLIRRSDSVWNLYGPTETTVWSSICRLREGCPITIGRPIQNTQFYVLDRRMRRVPVGISGELYIGGDGLAKGYLNQPELTDERFVANPFGPDGARLFRTGDEVRYRADGEIEYLGRLDAQVKVRGFRIELGEVELACAQQPGVKQALAIVREDAPGDKRLVCYIEPEPGATLDSSKLRLGITDKLPDFMVPQILLVESLPLTANGKIDRFHLPAPAEERRAMEGPRNNVEARLLTIWKDVLQLNKIGIEDNFFDLGGHSILAMQLLAEIEVAFSRRLPVATIFQAQTVEQMAAFLEESHLPLSAPLVALHPQGQLPPLFIVPQADGSALAYTDLANSLGPDQPVYVLQYVGYEDGRKPLERIEDIAASFVNEIRKVQPRGPYRLAGFCVGGVVAFEMAQRFVACGEEISLLALVETWYPSFIPPLQGAPAAMRPLLFLYRGAKRHIRAMLSLHPRQALRYLRSKSAIVKEMMLFRDVFRGDESKRYMSLVLEANYRAGSRYTPAPLAGRIVLFPVDLETKLEPDPRLVWKELARKGCLVVKITEKNLDDLLKKPHVRALAEGLADQLLKSRAADRGATG